MVKKWKTELNARGIVRMWQGNASGKIYYLANGSIMVSEQGKLSPPEWLMPLPFLNAYTQIFEDTKGNIWVNLNDGGGLDVP